MNKSIPADLRPLFDHPDPGSLITYDWNDPLFQAILKHHGDLPAVKAYAAQLKDFLGPCETATKPDRPLGPSKVANAKTAAVTTVVEAHGCHTKGGKRWLRAELDKANARIRELEDANRALGARLARLQAN